MDVRYINPFIESVKHLFKTMLETDLTLSKPKISQDDVHADASSVIGFSGDAVGCVVICFPITTAIRVASAFAGIEMTKDHEDFSDALGEIANIVAGQAKAKLEGFNINISLPSVIIGKEHTILRSKQRPRLAFACDSPHGRFTVEVAMVVTKTNQANEPQMAGIGTSTN